MSAEITLENKLRRLDPQLHRKYCCAVYETMKILRSGRAVFPEYTYHCCLHTINVLNYSNILIGSNISLLNCGEIYVLMMAAALHDAGVGISRDDFSEFISRENFSEYLTEHPDASYKQIIRNLHHELSGCFIKKYSMQLDIPDEFVYPIIMAAKGHRKIDLRNSAEYPEKYYSGKHIIRLPYIAAIVRLADEMDIEAEQKIYIEHMGDETESNCCLSAWHLKSAVKDIILTEKRCIILVDKNSLFESEMNEIKNRAKKLKSVMAYTADVIQRRSCFKMKWRTISVEYI